MLQPVRRKRDLWNSVGDLGALILGVCAIVDIPLTINFIQVVLSLRLPENAAPWAWRSSLPHHPHLFSDLLLKARTEHHVHAHTLCS